MPTCSCSEGRAGKCRVRGGIPPGNPSSHDPLVPKNGPCLWETHRTGGGGLLRGRLFKVRRGLSRCSPGWLQPQCRMESPATAGHLSPPRPPTSGSERGRLLRASPGLSRMGPAGGASAAGDRQWHSPSCFLNCSPPSGLEQCGGRHRITRSPHGKPCAEGRPDRATGRRGIGLATGIPVTQKLCRSIQLPPPTLARARAGASVACGGPATCFSNAFGTKLT